MKKALLYVLGIFLVFTLAADAAPKDEAGRKVAEAESMKRSLGSNNDLSAFIPFEIYCQASESTERARGLLDDGKYEDAIYYAREATIRFEIASLTAQARSARYQRMKLISNASSTGITTNPLMDAHFFKKGDVFRANVYDRQVFVVKKDHVYYRISSDGKDRLDRIIKVLTAYPNYNLKIVGHTAGPDYNDYSKQKADIVAKYFFEKNISSDRIEIIGLRNKEVMETHLGFRRVDRVEFIISAPR